MTRATRSESSAAGIVPAASFQKRAEPGVLSHVFGGLWLMVALVKRHALSLTTSPSRYMRSPSQRDRCQASFMATILPAGAP